VLQASIAIIVKLHHWFQLIHLGYQMVCAFIVKNCIEVGQACSL